MTSLAELSNPKTPLLSIITPTYNHRKFIGACIETVLAQTYSHWEQIIIDDGSTDETAEIVSRYNDPRIRYFYQKNQGIEALAHTYNKAIEMAQGDLIAILEGDDTWPTDKLEKMVPAFSNPNVVLAYGEMREIDPNGKIAVGTSDTSRKRRKLPDGVLFNRPVPTAARYMLTVHGHSLIPASTAVMRRSALETIGGFQYIPNQCYVDFPTFIELVFHGEFFYTPEIVGYRRLHSASATVRHTTRMTAIAREHLSILLSDPRFGLTPADRQAIEVDWLPVTWGQEFALGRLCLLEGRWVESRTHFVNALNLTDLRVTAGSIAGWVFSWFQHDLENLFELAGRASLKGDS